MYFVFICHDKPGHQQVRLENRQAHLDYLARFGPSVAAAGPTLSEDGQHMTGSVLIVDLADRAKADAFAAGDPYAQAGLFDSVDILPWRKVLPKE